MSLVSVVRSVANRRWASLQFGEIQSVDAGSWARSVAATTVRNACAASPERSSDAMTASGGPGADPGQPDLCLRRSWEVHTTNHDQLAVLEGWRAVGVVFFDDGGVWWF